MRQRLVVETGGVAELEDACQESNVSVVLYIS